MKEELRELCREVIGFIGAEQPIQESRFDELARKLFSFQIRHNQPYGALCKKHRISPESIRSFLEVPAVITSAFKAFGFTTLTPEDRKFVFYSSGTTAGDRSRNFHNDDTMRVYEESLEHWGKRFLPGSGESMRIVSLTPPGEQAPNSSLVHMFDTFGKRLSREKDGTVFCASVQPDGAWDLNFSKIEQVCGEPGKPVALCGTAFSFVHLCEWLQREQRIIKLPTGSMVLETGGYKGRSRVYPKTELHQMIRTLLGIPDTHLLTEYGMSELSSQAYDRIAGTSDDRVFRFPPWARARIISPENGMEVEDGRRGLLRVFDLANVGSVIAVQTEDVAVRRGEGFELVGRAAAAEARGCSLMNL